MSHFTITHIAHDALKKPMTFRFIKSKGEEFLFQKGDSESEQKITFANDFYLCAYLCTQEFWTAVLNATGSTKLNTTPSHFKGLLLPVEQVSWDDTQLFIDALNSLIISKNIRFLEEKVPLGRFNLPSEAQWEYAASAKQDHEFVGSNNLNDVGWYEENSNSQTNTVGLKQPNKNGLYDMSGNVWEWCQNDYVAIESNGEVSANKPENSKALRGGSYSQNANYCRPWYRYFGLPVGRGHDGGFRLVFLPSSKSSNEAT